jgi:hypothetical protein
MRVVGTRPDNAHTTEASPFDHMQSKCALPLRLNGVRQLALTVYPLRLKYQGQLAMTFYP